MPGEDAERKERDRRCLVTKADAWLRRVSFVLKALRVSYKIKKTYVLYYNPVDLALPFCNPYLPSISVGSKRGVVQAKRRLLLQEEEGWPCTGRGSRDLHNDIDDLTPQEVRLCI